MHKNNKTCDLCGRRMRRHGRTKSGTERYLCLVCKKTGIIRRTDTKVRYEKERFIAWLTGVQSKEDIAKRYDITRQTLSNEFRSFFRGNPNCNIPEGFKAKILIVDAKWIHGSEMCALVAVTEEDRIFWQFASAERYGTWFAFLVRFEAPEVVVADGHKGMAGFVKKHWPRTAFQRCHFHMVSLVIQYLSRNPKDEAGVEVLKLMYQLKYVKTTEDRDRWLMFHKIWEKRYEKVFAEKTESGQYAKKKLRSVRVILRRALPDLFTYLDYPGCPNTTNLVEGWVNTAIAEGLRRHRGMKLSQKKTLVSVILSNLTRGKTTRKFDSKNTPIFP